MSYGHVAKVGRKIMKGSRRLLYSIILLAVGVTATYVSGGILIAYSSSPNGGILTWDYGFPLGWKEVAGVACSSPQPSGVANLVLAVACVSACCSTSNNWIFFSVDVLFYMGIIVGAYLLLLNFDKHIREIGKSWLKTSENSTSPIES
jgi:hypothetical protein